MTTEHHHRTGEVLTGQRLAEAVELWLSLWRQAGRVVVEIDLDIHTRARLCDRLDLIAVGTGKRAGLAHALEESGILGAERRRLRAGRAQAARAGRLQPVDDLLR